MGDKGGNCWREGVTYSLWCEKCGEAVACYKGETGRNRYTRGLEHLDNLEARNEDKSVLWLHSVYHHQSQADIKYSMRVTGVYKDSLDRQVMEKGKSTDIQEDRAGRSKGREDKIQKMGKYSVDILSRCDMEVPPTHNQAGSGGGYTRAGGALGGVGGERGWGCFSGGRQWFQLVFFVSDIL